MEENRVKFRYIFDDRYNPQYANGAFGGITPHGEVVLNFYFERMNIPYEQEFSLQPDGTVGALQKNEPDSKYIRYVQNGVILSQQDARAFAQWLLKLLDEEGAD